MLFNFAVEEGVEERLAEVELAHARIEHCWMSAASTSVKCHDLGARLQRRALGRVRLVRAELRESGELLGTRTALLSMQIRRVLAQAGDVQEWPEVPDGVASLPGRRVGVKPRIGDGFPGRVNVRLALDLFETVRRAAYWLSVDAEQDLQEWADRHGPGPAAGGLALLAAALRGFPSAAEMQARDDARKLIITTGMILREAVWQVISPGPPDEASQQKLQDNAARAGKEVGDRVAYAMAKEAADRKAST